MYFTLYKNTLAVTASAAVLAFSGCAHRVKPSNLFGLEKIGRLDEARLAYEHGEYYKSRVQVQSLLAQNPDNVAAQQLMGDVLEKEISRQKEALLASHVLTSDGKNTPEIKTWLERSRTLLHQGQYDLALFAAEKVFVYDANNSEASLLIDDIKEAAIKHGKSDSLFLSKMYQEEISERVKKYRSQANELAEQNKTEQAKFALQKILMLEPEDPESLRLFHSLQAKETQE